MKIEDHNNTVRFDSISAGQFFVLDDVIYLRTEYIVIDDNYDYNAVRVDTGCHYYFDADACVDKVLKGKYIAEFR
jgi:hypothetical protein